MLVPRKKRFVRIVHVAADTDRAFRHQTLFAGFLASHVMEHGVAMGDERVGNDLLVGRIVFGLGARQKKIISARKQCAQVFLRLEIQPVKTAELVEQTAPDDENIFIGRGH